MLLSEALLLLLLDEEKGSTITGAYAHDDGLAGALLLDLLAAGALAEHDGKLVAAGVKPAELAAAYDVVAREPRTAQKAMAALVKALKPIKAAVAGRLVDHGVLDERHHKRLGVFPTTRYPERDAGPESALRAELRAVLVDGAEPSPFVTALLALVVPMRLVGRLVGRDERKPAERRAKELAAAGPVGDAVRAAVQRQITAAVIAATTAASVAATASN